MTEENYRALFDRASPGRDLVEDTLAAAERPRRKGGPTKRLAAALVCLALVLGVGNRRVTADALGPRTVQHILVTMGHSLPLRGIRPVAAVAPGVSQAAGLSLQALAAALVGAVRPTALLCVDSLCTAEAERLGRTIQLSDTGLAPASPRSPRHLDAAALGLPVVAAGIPTLMEAAEGRDLVVTPRALDSVIAHGAALLGAAINRALQPRLTVNQLCWLASQS